MEIFINDLENKKLNAEKIKVTIEHMPGKDIKNFIEYVKEYERQTVIVKQDNELVQIDLQNIILFYSYKKSIYCKTKDAEYRVKNTLYDIQFKNPNFIRISRSHIINIKHLESFDIGQTGIIIAKLTNGIKVKVSRRKAREIMNYIENRSI